MQKKSWIVTAIFAACFITNTFASQTLGVHPIIASKESPMDITEMLKKRHVSVEVKNPHTGKVTYSQDGNFMLDEHLYFIQSNGNRLQAYPMKEQDPMSKLVDVKIPYEPMAPKQTTTMLDILNLNADDSMPDSVFNPTDSRSYNYVIQQTIYDSLGSAHQFAAYFMKTEIPNDWRVVPIVDGDPIGTGTLTFSTSGRLAAATGLSNLTFAPRTGAVVPQQISLNMTGTTGYASLDASYSIMQDGYAAGIPTAFMVDDDGFIAITYTNGMLDNYYKIPFFNV